LSEETHEPPWESWVQGGLSPFGPSGPPQRVAYRPVDELIQKAAQTIVDLGISTQEALAPYVQAWAKRPVAMETTDEDQDLANFLTGLFRAGVINRSQGRTLLGMLTAQGGAGGPVAVVPPGEGPPPDDPYIGRRFGSFVAETFVGEGAMGKVYRAARKGTLERDYVIKVFGSRDEESVARFRREAEIMAQIDNEHVVKVVASGQEGSVPFMVLEYVEGPTLDQMLADRGTFSWKSAFRAVKQVAIALHAAHELGIVHRDIKPANVLVARGGKLKVFDFGLAKVTTHSSLSKAGEILGSPAFIAPEQWGDREVDFRADLFALGVLSYLLITGKTPFRGRTPADYAAAIQRGEFVPLHEADPKVSPGASQLVSALLERDRDHRPSSAKALIADFDRALRGKAPNVARFEVVDGDPTVDRYPLLGKSGFTVGSANDADVRLQETKLQHATLVRTAGGYLLTAKATVVVNGNRSNEIVLRDRDRVQFAGGPPLIFRTGYGHRATTRHNPVSERVGAVKDLAGEDATEEPVEVPGLLIEALIAVGHPRALNACFEALDAGTLAVRHAHSYRALTEAGIAADQIELAAERAKAIADERASHLADVLFERTKENLGREAEPWLSYWADSRQNFPRQFRPPGARAAGTLNVNLTQSASSFSKPLDQGELWTLGRAEDAEITLNERSVSRYHLRLIRLNTRIMVQDLGSRFGTNRDGKRVTVGILRHGDRLDLGKTNLIYEDVLEGAPPVTSPLVEIDVDMFEALVAARHPSTAVTLVRLLGTPALADYCVARAAPHEDLSSIGMLVMDYLDQARVKALAALPAVAQVDFGEDAAAWTAWLNEAAAGLGPQVIPGTWSK